MHRHTHSRPKLPVCSRTLEVYLELYSQLLSEVEHVDILWRRSAPQSQYKVDAVGQGGMAPNATLLH